MREQAAEQRRREAHDLAEQHGARIERVGNLWHVRGPTIDIRVADLALLTRTDFGNGLAHRRSG